MAPLHSDREAHSPPFADRTDAGRRLAALLEAEGLNDPVVVALPRGGVPIGVEVASALSAPLELLLVRKIGAPGHEEYGLGAVVDGAEPQLVLNEEAMRLVAPPQGYVEAETRRQLVEIERRRHAYIGDRAPLSLRGRAVVLVDDGIATGGTVRAALRALRQVDADRVVLGVPVMPAALLATLRAEADDVVAVLLPEQLGAVGQFYQHFPQLDDEEVVTLLAAAAAEARIRAG